MSRKIAALFGVLFAGALSAENAHAVSFDFVAYAAGNEHGAVSETFTQGSLSVTASGRSLDGSATYLMYLDDLSGGGPGGLGVCKSTVGTECVPGDDDNLSKSEVLVLNFSEEVSLRDILFSNGTHSDFYSGNFGVAIGGNPTSVGDFTAYPQLSQFAGPLVGTTFYFISDSTMSGINTDPHVIYISAFTAEPIDVPGGEVPEPSTVALLGCGLVGLITRRRARS